MNVINKDQWVQQFKLQTTLRHSLSTVVDSVEEDLFFSLSLALSQLLVNAQLSALQRQTALKYGHSHFQQQFLTHHDSPDVLATLIQVAEEPFKSDVIAVHLYSSVGLPYLQRHSSLPVWNGQDNAHSLKLGILTANGFEPNVIGAQLLKAAKEAGIEKRALAKMLPYTRAVKSCWISDEDRQIAYHRYSRYDQALIDLLKMDVREMDSFCTDEQTNILHEEVVVYDSNNTSPNLRVTTVRFEDAPDGVPLPGYYLTTDSTLRDVEQESGVDLSPSLTYDGEGHAILLGELQYVGGYRLLPEKAIDHIVEMAGRRKGEQNDSLQWCVTMHHQFLSDNGQNYVNESFHHRRLPAALLQLLNADLQQMLHPGGADPSACMTAAFITDHTNQQIASLHLEVGECMQGKTIDLHIDAGVIDTLRRTWALPIGNINGDNPLSWPESQDSNLRIPLAIIDGLGRVQPLIETYWDIKRMLSIVVADRVLELAIENQPPWLANLPMPPAEYRVDVSWEDHRETEGKQLARTFEFSRVVDAYAFVTGLQTIHLFNATKLATLTTATVSDRGGVPIITRFLSADQQPQLQPGYYIRLNLDHPSIGLIRSLHTAPVFKQVEGLTTPHAITYQHVPAPPSENTGVHRFIQPESKSAAKRR